MKKQELLIKETPAVLYGEECGKAFLFVHGQCGCKEEAGRFAKVAVPAGWQVLGVDLPGHGGRSDAAEFLPWDVIPELHNALAFLKERCGQIGIRANSIGAYFSLLAFAKEKIEKCLFVSPLLDMENMIGGMMQSAGVTEQQLKKASEIPTASGQTLSWKYLCYAKQYPVAAICPQTDILYGTRDALIPETVFTRFTKDNACRLTRMEGGEHWFHTDEQLAFMREWERKCLRD